MDATSVRVAVAGKPFDLSVADAPNFLGGQAEALRPVRFSNGAMRPRYCQAKTAPREPVDGFFFKVDGLTHVAAKYPGLNGVVGLLVRPAGTMSWTAQRPELDVHGFKIYQREKTYHVYLEDGIDGTRSFTAVCSGTVDDVNSYCTFYIVLTSNIEIKGNVSTKKKPISKWHAMISDATDFVTQMERVDNP